MYQCQNGWTKQRMIEQIKLKNNGEGAYDRAAHKCLYETRDGNRCAVGCFIPDGHESLSFQMGVSRLVKAYPDILSFLPLGSDGMCGLQAQHDNAACEERCVRQPMIGWIEKNVKD